MWTAGAVVRSGFFWTAILLVASGLTVAASYSTMHESGDDCSVETTGSATWSMGAGSWLFGVLAVGLLAYALFVTAKPAIRSGSRGRHLLVALALVAASAIFFELLLATATGVHLPSGRRWFLAALLPGAVASLAYGLIILPTPDLGRKSSWRYALGVPFALLAAVAVFIAAAIPVAGYYC